MSFSIQKANFWKRFSAWLFDTVILVVLALSISLLTFEIFVAKPKEVYTEKFNISRAYQLEVAKQMDFTPLLTTEQYKKLPEEEKGDYLSQEVYDKFSKEEKAAYDAEKEAYIKALNADERALALYNDALQAQTSFYLKDALSYALSLFVATLIWHFILPLFLKQGRSVGKRVFGLAVIRTNQVKASNAVLFIRCMIGLYAIETIFPIFLFLIGGTLGIVLLVAFFVMQIAVMFKTDTNSSIHDLLTDTVVVDMASQKIYQTQEERIEAQKAQAAEKAEEPEVQMVRLSSTLPNDKE